MSKEKTLAALSRSPFLRIYQSRWESIRTGKIGRIVRRSSLIVTKAGEKLQSISHRYGAIISDKFQTRISYEVSYYSTEEPYKRQSTNLKRVSDFEKFLLVRFGYYPSKDQVPNELPRDRLARVWEKMRIFVNS